jgi:RND superfamily putative drug exporter
LNKFFEKLGKGVVKYRYLVIILWLVVIVVSSKTLPSLGSEVNNDNSQFLPASAPSQRANLLATPILGNPNINSQITIVAYDNSAKLTQADLGAVKSEVGLAKTVPNVSGVKVLALSPDGHALQMLASVDLNQSDITGQTQVINDLQATFHKVSTPPGLQFNLAGNVATNVANQNASQKTGSQTQRFSFLFIIVLLLIIFRSVLAPIMTLIPAGITLLVANRFIGGLGAHGLQISEITQLLLIVLILGAGTDYGLFLVFRVREEMLAGYSSKEATARALTRVGESITASAATVIIALLSLLLATFGIYHDLGVPLAVGIGVMLIAGLTLLPAMLAICGKALFWPTNLTKKNLSQHNGTWGKIATKLVQKPGKTLAVGVVVFVALAMSALSYSSGGFGGALNAPNGSGAAKGNAALLTHFPHSGLNPANIIFSFNKPVWSDPQVLSSVNADLAHTGQFKELLSPLDANGTQISPAEYQKLHNSLGDPRLLPTVMSKAVPGVSEQMYQEYRETTQFVSADGKVVQFEAILTAGPQQSTSAMNATPEIRNIVNSVGARNGALAEGLTGEAASLYDVSSTSNHDLLTIIPVAIIAIGLLLALVLRSVLAPLYLIISVALSYLASLGVSTIVFIDIQKTGGITFILPFLMFIFLLALGEDYNILIMTRIREEVHNHDLKTAVAKAVGRTGSTVTSAGLVLAGTFAVLAIAGGSGPSGSEIREIGFGLAIGILMDTFLVRTLLVPSIVSLLGKWNWWPSKLYSGEAASTPDDETDKDYEMTPA